MSDFADLLRHEAQGFPDFLQFDLHRFATLFFGLVFILGKLKCFISFHRTPECASQLPRSANRLQAQIYQHMHINLSYMSVFLLLHIIQHVGEGSQNS